MKRLISMIGLGILVLTAMPAQDEAAHEGWMKDAQATMGGLRKALMNKDESAVESAKKLQGIFADVEKFWAGRHVEDAVEAAKSAQEAAGQIAAKAAAGEDAMGSFGALAGSCKSCHTAHREKAADGSWKIK